MDGAVGDRRADPRVTASVLHPTQATLRPGCPVDLVDISPAGAQVESDRPLRPGSRVHVRVVTHRWTVAVAAMVLRCVVCTLHPERGVKYRGALQFEERCAAVGDG
jgi:hypothetical protein